MVGAQRWLQGSLAQQADRIAQQQSSLLKQAEQTMRQRDVIDALLDQSNILLGKKARHLIPTEANLEAVSAASAGAQAPNAPSAVHSQVVMGQNDRTTPASTRQPCAQVNSSVQGASETLAGADDSRLQA